MRRRALMLLTGLALAGMTRADDPQLGLKVAAVPELLRGQVALEPGQGVLVVHVETNSRAAEIGLRPNDIIVTVGAAVIRNGTALDAKLRALQADEREVLEVIRGGQKIVLSWPNVARYSPVDKSFMPPKSYLKPGGPPSVSVQAHPLPSDRFDVTILYNTPNSGKLARQSLQGSVAEVERQVADLARQGHIPADVHDLIAVALDRLRSRTTAPQPSRR